MTEPILWTATVAYLLRAAYTAGVIKAWLQWSGKPYDAFNIAWAGATWPVVLWRGWKEQRRG